MSDVYDIWLYPLQDWWRTVNEMSDFMKWAIPFFALCWAVLKINLKNMSKHIQPISHKLSSIKNKNISDKKKILK